MRRDVEFASQGAILRGWFYEPDTGEPWPVVVMAHGFSATRHMVADRYAEVFRDAGFAVLLYDHYGFGDSGGEPRRQINPWMQARGYRDALAFTETLDGADPEHLAIWGDSMSGGVATVVAGVDERVKALVVQVPALGAQPAPADTGGEAYRAFRETLLTGDVVPSGGDVSESMPVVSDDQVRRPSALKPLTAYRWFIEYGGRHRSGWVNDVTRARPSTPVEWHAGLAAPHVTCPSLFLVAPDDEMAGAAPDVSREVFEQLAGPKEWVEIDGGHFGLLCYPSETFIRASAVQAAFLTRTLRSGP